MAQTTDNPESNRAHPEVLAQGNDLAQSVLARADWPRTALSSWVQRSWQAHPTQAGQQRQTAFSERYTQALINRVFRQVETSRVWRPDVGSIAPDTFERFANDIAERHQPVSNKYFVQTGQENPQEGDELTLSLGGPVGVGVGLSRKSSKLQPATPPPSFISPQPVTPLSPPAMQRSPAQPARPNIPPAASTPSQPARPIQRRRNVRIFSQVQEMTPGDKTWAEIKPEPIPGAEADLLPAERRESRDQEVEAGEAEHISPLVGAEAVNMPLAPAEASPPSVQRMAELTSAVAAETHPLPDRSAEFSPPRELQVQKTEPDSPQVMEGVPPRQAKPAGSPQAQRQAEQPPARPTLISGPAEPTPTPQVFEELPGVQRLLENETPSPAAALHQERLLVSQPKAEPSSGEVKPAKEPVSQEEAPGLSATPPVQRRVKRNQEKLPERPAQEHPAPQPTLASEQSTSAAEPERGSESPATLQTFEGEMPLPALSPQEGPPFAGEVSGPPAAEVEPSSPPASQEVRPGRAEMPLVQRSIEREQALPPQTQPPLIEKEQARSAPAEAPESAAKAVELPGPPVGQEMKPGRAEMPLVQRSIEPEPELLLQVQPRSIESEQAEFARVEAPERAAKAAEPPGPPASQEVRPEGAEMPLVQRSIEREPELPLQAQPHSIELKQAEVAPVESPETSAKVAESPSPPSGQAVRLGGAEMPLVQRSIEPEPELLPQAQPRSIEEEKTRPAPSEAPELAAKAAEPPGLAAGQEVRPGGAEMPLVQWPIQHEQALPFQAQPQLRDAEEAEPAPTEAPEPPVKSGRAEMPLVQRSIGREPELSLQAQPRSREKEQAESIRPETPELAAKAVELPGPPAGQPVKSGRATMPLVQQYAEREQRLPSQAQSHPAVRERGRPIQRQLGADEPATGLEQEVLRRTTLGTRLPLIEPSRSVSHFGEGQRLAETSEGIAGRLTLTRPGAQTAMFHLAQPSFDEAGATLVDAGEPATPAHFRPQGSAARLPFREPRPHGLEPATVRPNYPQARGSELPLPPVSRSADPASVQRQADSSPESAVASQQAGLVQRVEETSPGTGEAPVTEGSLVDLDHLAQQVYPLIKRMLAIERERRSSR